MSRFALVCYDVEIDDTGIEEEEEEGRYLGV
jgi:hypothetical protein